MFRIKTVFFISLILLMACGPSAPFLEDVVQIKDVSRSGDTLTLVMEISDPIYQVSNLEVHRIDAHQHKQTLTKAGEWTYEDDLSGLDFIYLKDYSTQYLGFKYSATVETEGRSWDLEMPKYYARAVAVDIVWTFPGDTRYHKHSCTTIGNNTVTPHTRTEASDSGHTACLTCNP